MENKEKLRLREKDAFPTSDVLEKILGNSYNAYDEFQGMLSELEIEQNWQWYNPHKVWCAKGQYFWTTTRGTKKEKNLYWLNVCEGYFNVTVWFKEKNRSKVLNINVADKTKQIITSAKTEMCMPTFPVRIKVTNLDILNDIYKLIEIKKELESK